MSGSLNAPASWVSGDRVTVWVIGAGGNGGEVVDALAQFHTALLALGAPGLSVAVIDDAVVREVNLVRQRFWSADVGSPKATTLVHRYNCLLGTDWIGIPMRLEDTLEHYAPRTAPNIIISAVDLPSVRCYIGNGMAYEGQEGHFKTRQLRETLWLDLGNKARNGQAVLGKLLPSADAPNVLSHYPELATLEDDNTKSCSTAEALYRQDCLVNRMVATAGMTILWELLRHGHTDKNGVVLDLASGMQMPIGFPAANVERH